MYPIASSAESARRYLQGGAPALQFRLKSGSDSAFYAELVRVNRLCRDSGAVLLVNDRVDMALAVGAQGVHLGQDDLPPEEARRLLGSEAIIGLSTHNDLQFESAQSRRDIDYVAIGPIFETATKPSGNPAIGLDGLAALTPRKRFPLVAIGGIDLGSAPSLWRAGVESVAVISDLSRHPDPARRVREYMTAGEEIRS